MAHVSLIETIKQIGLGTNRLAQIAVSLGGGVTDYDVAKALRPVSCARVNFGNVELRQQQPRICKGCVYTSNCPRR